MLEYCNTNPYKYLDTVTIDYLLFFSWFLFIYLFFWNSKGFYFISFFFFFLVVFAIHWHESAMDLHVFPIQIPSPAFFSICYEFKNLLDPFSRYWKSTTWLSVSALFIQEICRVFLIFFPLFYFSILYVFKMKSTLIFNLSSVQFSCSVVSDSLRVHWTTAR